MRLEAEQVRSPGRRVPRGHRDLALPGAVGVDHDARVRFVSFAPAGLPHRDPESVGAAAQAFDGARLHHFGARLARVIEERRVQEIAPDRSPPVAPAVRHGRLDQRLAAEESHAAHVRPGARGEPVGDTERA